MKRSDAIGRIGVAWQRVRTEPGLFRDIAVLVGVIVLGLTAGGIILSQQRVTWPWEDTFSFSATFAETAGISPGNGQEVRIAGVPVGEITGAGIDEQGRAVVDMQIDGRYEIFDNARLVMRPKSPLNEIFVNIDPGGPPAGPIQDGTVLPLASTEKAVQIDEVLAHLDDNTREALGALLRESDVALTHAPTDLPAGIEAADLVLTRLEPVVTELDTRRATIARLVNALAEISTAAGRDDARLAGLADGLATTLRSVAVRGGDLDAALAQLPELSDSLRAATDGVTDLAGQLDPTLRNVRDAGDALPGALERLTGSVDTLDTTLDVARPFLAEARPMVADLRPLVVDLDLALDDLEPITADFEPITGRLLPYLTDLQAFIYNTNSMTSLHDANKGILRGQFTMGPTSLPLPLGDVATPLPGEDR